MSLLFPVKIFSVGGLITLSLNLDLILKKLVPGRLDDKRGVAQKFLELREVDSRCFSNILQDKISEKFANFHVV